MCDLPQRMNARVGPPRSEQLKLSREQLARDILQFALDSLGVVLYLPAAISSAFVFEFEFPGRQLFVSDLYFLAELIDRDVDDFSLRHFHLVPALAAEPLGLDHDVDRDRG